MAATFEEIIVVFGDVIALFGTAPLSYLVAITIAGAAVYMIRGLFSRD